MFSLSLVHFRFVHNTRPVRFIGRTRVCGLDSLFSKPNDDHSFGHDVCQNSGANDSLLMKGLFLL